MRNNYTSTYQQRNNFLKWCQHWTQNGSVVYHTSWGSYYPKFKFIEYNTRDVLKKHSEKPHMHSSKEYHAIDEQGTHCFFDKKMLFKGEWRIECIDCADELFE